MMEIGVFGNDCETIRCGVAPDGLIWGILQAHVPYVDRVGKQALQYLRQVRREILVKEKLHTEGGEDEASWRSRSAAKERQAWMSSEVRSEKSDKTCSSVIPDARYSKTS